MFEYQLLPTPTAAKKVKGVKTVEGRFARSLADTLNEQAKSGWEFVTQESFSFDDKGGMMSKTKAISSSFLVFRREVTEDAVPLDLKLEKMKEKRASPLQTSRRPFPEPAPSPQNMDNSFTPDPAGEEPTKAFQPLHTSEKDSSIAPSFGPASKV